MLALEGRLGVMDVFAMAGFDKILTFGQGIGAQLHIAYSVIRPFARACLEKGRRSR